MMKKLEAQQTSVYNDPRHDSSVVGKEIELGVIVDIDLDLNKEDARVLPTCLI